MSSHLGVSLPFLSDYYTDGQKKWARRLPLVLFFKESLPPGSAFLLARSMTSPFSIPHSLVAAAVTF